MNMHDKICDGGLSEIEQLRAKRRDELAAQQQDRRYEGSMRCEPYGKPTKSKLIGNKTETDEEADL